MKRYPAFDPPEYLDWAPDPRILSEYAARIVRDPDRAAVVRELDRERLLRLYRDLLRTRLHDIALKRWVRTGVISKAWLGTGEEAATVGAVAALEPGRDVVSPMIRNAGALHMMGMPLADMFRGYLATPDSPSGGRDLHIGSLPLGIIQPISHMGTNVTVIAGAALAFRMRGEARVALTWVGDGASRTGESHEGLNLAAAQKLPAVFVLQNNQVALGTATTQHTAADLRRLGESYGMPDYVCDGNNVLDVLAATTLAVRRCREGGGPAMVVAETFRMGGHATHDEREARELFPEEVFAYWGRRDPIGVFEAFLMEDPEATDTRDSEGLRVPGGPVTAGELRAVEEEVLQEMEGAAEEALASRNHEPDPEAALYPGVSEGGVLTGLERRPV
ncbi:MAG: thiamine pyrophosphate-dependent dehydrogenase E1 component subunit alpha [Gemmatimonadota bacterium]